MNLCLVSRIGVYTSDLGEFNLTAVIDIRRGEILLGFYVRAGAWIDGIEILTSLGRKSGVYGNANGGSGYAST